MIIFAMAFFAYIRYSQTYHIIKFAVFLYFIWPYVTLLSALLLVLRLVGAGILRESFLYIVSGTANFCIGAIGSYLITTSDTSLSWTFRAMFYANLIISIIIFCDVFRRRDDN